jgi:hypothetical protein
VRAALTLALAAAAAPALAGDASLGALDGSGPRTAWQFRVR